MTLSRDVCSIGELIRHFQPNYSLGINFAMRLSLKRRRNQWQRFLGHADTSRIHESFQQPFWTTTLSSTAEVAVLFSIGSGSNIWCKSNGTRCRSVFLSEIRVLKEKFFYQNVELFLLFRIIYNLFFYDVHTWNSVRKKRGTLKNIPHFSCNLEKWHKMLIFISLR
jgi:hypothetical protein